MLSRYPIVETHAVFAPFHCGGVTLDLGDGREVAVFSLWIRHLPDYGAAAKGGATPAEVAARPQTRAGVLGTCEGPAGTGNCGVRNVESQASNSRDSAVAAKCCRMGGRMRICPDAKMKNVFIFSTNG